MTAKGLNDFERCLAGILGEKELAAIQKVKIGIAGAGGLGSNCALFLVRSGFKKFRIVDFDVVEYSNLNRQFYFANQVGRRKVGALKENLLRINPDLEIEALAEKIEQENVHKLFTCCDVVVEALDQACYKKLVVEAYLHSGKLLVAVSGLAGWGISEGIKIRRVKEKFFLVGDLESEVQPARPALAPGVNVAAAKQADVILNYVAGHLEGYAIP